MGKRKGGTKQIIMITDGEPHANSAGWNTGGWNMREAMEETLREVQRCSRDGVTVNTFMLDSEPVMSRFVRLIGTGCRRWRFCRATTRPRRWRRRTSLSASLASRRP